MRFAWLVPPLVVLALASAALDEEAGVARWWHLRGELADAEARIEGLREDVARLRAESAGLQGDAFALERAIREELHLVRPGQLLVRWDEASSGGIP